MIECINPHCRGAYDTYEGNFYKKKLNKNGYDPCCIQCSKEYKSRYIERLPQEKLEEIRSKNIENYKERRKVLSNNQAKYDRILKKLSIYSRKLYWMPEPYRYMGNIGEDEY